MSQAKQHFDELLKVYNRSVDDHSCLALIVLAASIERAAERVAKSIDELEVTFTTKKPFEV